MDTNNRVYFCGSVNSADMLFGYVTSTLLTSIQVTYAFKYGSPDTDKNFECALTNDDTYFIGVFTTSHSVPRATNYGSSSSIDSVYTYPTTLTSPYDNPYSSCSCSTSTYSYDCVARTAYEMLSAAQEQAI